MLGVIYCLSFYSSYFSLIFFNLGCQKLTFKRNHVIWLHLLPSSLIAAFLYFLLWLCSLLWFNFDFDFLLWFSFLFRFNQLFFSASVPRFLLTNVFWITRNFHPNLFFFFYYKSWILIFSIFNYCLTYWSEIWGRLLPHIAQTSTEPSLRNVQASQLHWARSKPDC